MKGVYMPPDGGPSLSREDEAALFLILTLCFSGISHVPDIVLRTGDTEAHEVCPFTVDMGPTVQGRFRTPAAQP